ncbi:MAG: exodeoxyribonuclease VII small subunit [Cyclobacteriaceae bacterium]|nr:exodeoxyribonuclease VII small subunit [Cyclobacteriaceae bacterium]
MTTKKFNYKKALEEIEVIVQKIENEDPDVDELSTMVKRAAELIKQCKTKLKTTGEELDGIIQDLEE